MDTLILVLCFPLLLTAGYGLAYLFSGRNRTFLVGPAGFMLYLALLAVPLSAVALSRPDLPGEVLAATPWSAAWLPAGLAVGLALWGVQLLLLRHRPVQGDSPVWVGPPGRAGFLLLLIPVGYIVLAEELVWRGYLTQVIGLPLSSAAFALHHYHFGIRHVVFSFVAGLAWGGLFLAAGDLWASIASHLLYDALAWHYLRRFAKAG